MFAQTAPSVADIAAISGNRNDGWGNGFGDAWWIIILFAIFGWGRGGNGMFGGSCGCDSACATVGDVERGFNQQTTNQRFNALDGAFAQLGYANQQQGFDTIMAVNGAQTAITGSINEVSRQLADCCCENRLSVANLNAAIAADTCAVTTAISNAARDITENQNANYRALHDEIVANRLEDKNAQIAELQSQVQALNLAQSQANQNNYLVNTLRPCPVPAYISCNPWGGAQYGACNTGCCC